MSTALLSLTVVAPLLVAVFVAIPNTRRLAVAAAPWTSVPALAAVLVVSPDVTIDMPWLLLGARIGLDVTGQMFLAFTSLLWLMASIYAGPYLRHDVGRRRFFAFYLVAMSGNFGLILAHDILTFLVFYSMMSFSSYGLITHDGRAESRRAGRIYITLVVLGEVLLFAGLVLAALQAGSLLFEPVRRGIVLAPLAALIVALLLVGFGIKMGLVPLHYWLPLAHPVAPTPASAVLSGTMIKAGLLGCMRFLPLGEATMPAMGGACTGIGFLTAFFGVCVGLTQTNAKTVLAYSSVSQMGLIVVAVGSTLTQPAAWPTASAALTLFAFHHAISKGALFLGVGVADGSFGAPWKRWLVRAGLILPALALSGAPLTLGSAAKAALQQTTTNATIPWAELCQELTPISSFATTLLMARFLQLVWQRPREELRRISMGMWLPWSLTAASAVGMMAILRWHDALDSHWFENSPAIVWKHTWPIMAATALVALFLCNPSLSTGLRRPHIPPGDVVVPITILSFQLVMSWNRHVVYPLRRCTSLVSSWWSASSPPTVPLSRVSAFVENWRMVGVFVMLLAATLFVLLASP